MVNLIALLIVFRIRISSHPRRKEKTVRSTASVDVDTHSRATSGNRDDGKFNFLHRRDPFSNSIISPSIQTAPKRLTPSKDRSSKDPC